MAEAVLEVFLEPVLENLSSLIQKQLGMILGVDREMETLSSTLTTIQAVLEDAQEKQLTNKPIKIWLQKLKDAAHVLDGILDDCATEAIRLEYEGMHFGLKRSVLSYLNPKHVWFRHKIAEKMKNISQKLDEISEERSKFHLRQTDIIERGAQVMGWRETTSIITEPQVYGREEDKEKIVDYLVSQASNFEDLLVYPIVGMGGLGKTTLAQLIFNDERVAKHFEPRIWVCISEAFELKIILKAIIESATGQACDDMNLEALQKKVQRLVERKRYLLVLDDVWNEDPEKWDKLKYVVKCGSKGASILTTTRLPKVASIMGTMPPHQLSILSEDDCWTLFKHRAFGPNKGEPEELVAIGKEIVKKCRGVPLLAKALGGLLRFKSEEREWLYVKESELWSLAQEEDSMMPALRLSYSNLSGKLRQCFAFCAIFPKDEEISKQFLIELWMANGFISSNGNLEAEDVGDEVWNELCWRSFFQDIKTDERGKIRFKMHDLVHDLAQAVVAGEVCCINDDSGLTNLSGRTRHVSMSIQTAPSQCVKSLKTWIIRGTDYDILCLSAPLKCHSLRVLQCKYLHELPSSVGHLKHLRYLNLSKGKFKILPKSICSLWNLQILNLNYCHELQRLPKKLTHLRALRHLHLIRCWKLSSLPPGIGQLTFLKTLNVYIVDKKKGFLLAELEHLNLTGELCIQYLEKVRSVTDAREANMVNKKLDKLELSWSNEGESESQENAEQILEALAPLPQLKYLEVVGYGGIHFPQWMGSATFKYLYKVELTNCSKCLQLPLLGKLPSLKELSTRSMNKVRYVDEESYIGGVATGFKALEHLTLYEMPNLERLSKEDGQDIFPRLSRMRIDECPKLALPCLPSLRELEIWSECSQALLGSIHNVHNLESLEFYDHKELDSIPDGMLRNLTALQSLTLIKLPNLGSLPDCFGNLSNLRSFVIQECPKLMCLPMSIQGLCNLEDLYIARCPELKKRCEKETGEDWHKIAHVPNVLVF